MAEVKDKLITAESLKAAYDANKQVISKLSEEIANKTGTGLSTEAIDKLEEVGNYLVYTTADGGSKWTELISILRNGSSGGGSGGTEVTLSSISATYIGGNVAVGTALTDLTELTVKATYSDGSTKNVTGYTLSGTIAEGSNTITVSYQGKTTTFTVTGIAEETEVPSLRGIQLPSVPTNWSTNDDWQYAGNSGNLYELIGSKYLYIKQVFSGTVYVRTVAKTPYSNYAVGMKLVAEDYLTNQTAEGETLTETTKTIKFNNQFLYVSTDGSEYEYLTSEPDDGRYCVRLQKFDIPEGQVAILHMLPPSSSGTINIDGGWNTVFFEDPTNHITVTEVYE